MSASRSHHIEIIDNIIKSTQSEFIIIHGNEKTKNGEWIYKHIDREGSNVPIFYISEREGEVTLRDFNQAIDKFFPEKASWLSRLTWHKAFSLLKRITLQHSKKFVLILDDFPYFDTDKKQFDALLAHYWEKRWSSSGNMKLFLCGNTANPQMQLILKGGTSFASYATHQMCRTQAGDFFELGSSRRSIANSTLSQMLIINEKTEKEKRLQANAKLYGYACKNVFKDGNCFFYALLHQLNLFDKMKYQDYTSTKIRHDILENIILYRDFYQAFIEQPFDEFITKMHASGEWVHDVMVYASSCHFNVNIAIVRSDDNAPTILQRSNPLTTFYLGYEVGSHYQSLVKDPAMIATREFNFSKAEVNKFEEMVLDKQRLDDEACAPQRFERVYNPNLFKPINNDDKGSMEIVIDTSGDHWRIVHR